MQCSHVCNLTGHQFYVIPDESKTPRTTSATPLHTVGKHGIGRITFHEPVMISGTDLCDALRLEHGLVEVCEKSETNCQINKPATVVFENIRDFGSWYLERTQNGTTTVIASSEVGNGNGCLYDVESGIFQFTVPGFSKYKLRLGDRSSRSNQNSSTADDHLSFSDKAPASPCSTKPDVEQGEGSSSAMSTTNSPFSNFVVRNLTNDLASAATFRNSTSTDMGDKFGRFHTGVSHSEPENVMERTNRTGNDVLDGLSAFAEDYMNDAKTDALNTREPSAEMLDLFFEEYVTLCNTSVQNGENVLIPFVGREYFVDFVSGKLMRSPYQTQAGKDLWASLTLISVLWENAETSNNHDTFKADGSRISEAFFSWLKEVLKEYPCNQCAVGEDLYTRVFHKLIDLNVNHAALIAKHWNDRALAELIAAHRESRFHPIYQAVIHELITKNEASDTSIRKILLLLSGRIFMDDLSVCENLDWLHSFAVCAYYVGTDEPQSLEALFCLYEDCCLYDAYCTGPSDDLTIGRPPRILYSIIRLFLGVGDFQFMEATEFVHWNPLYKWIFLCTLKCVGLSLPVGRERQLREDLITALVDWNKWEYAVALLLHQQPGKKRNDRIRELIALNAKSSLSNTHAMRFLTEKLAINEKWIFEAKAACALDEGNYVEAARLLLLLEKPGQAVDVLVNKLFFRWKRNGNFEESLLAIVENLEPYFSGGKSTERGDQLYKPLFEAVKTYYHLKIGAHHADDSDGTDVRQLSSEKLKEDIERIRPLLAHPKVKCRDFVEDLIEKSEQLVAQFQSTNIVDRLKGAFTRIFG